MLCIVVFHYLLKSTTQWYYGFQSRHQANSIGCTPVGQCPAIYDHSQGAREIEQEVATSILGDKSLLCDPLWFSYGNYGEHLVGLQSKPV